MIKKILSVVLCLCLIFGISAMATNSTDNSNTQAPDFSEEMPVMPDGEMPRGRMAPPGNGGNGQRPQPANEENASGETSDTINENTIRMPRGGMGGQGGMQENIQNISETPETQSQNGMLDFVKNYSTPIFSVILLILAFVFVVFYKRKSY